MSRVCQLSKKRAQRGNNVSHANNKSRKEWRPNLQNKRLFDSETGQWVRVRLSSRMLRTVSKKGLAQTLRDLGMKLSDLHKGA
jgi:large subunit ribosomal protein L28